MCNFNAQMEFNVDARIINVVNSYRGPCTILLYSHSLLGQHYSIPDVEISNGPFFFRITPDIFFDSVLREAIPPVPSSLINYIIDLPFTYSWDPQNLLVS